MSLSLEQRVLELEERVDNLQFPADREEMVRPVKDQPLSWVGYDVPSICLGIIIALVIFLMLQGAANET